MLLYPVEPGLISLFVFCFLFCLLEIFNIYIHIFLKKFTNHSGLKTIKTQKNWQTGK